MPYRLNTLLTSSRELSRLTDKAGQLMTLQRQLEQTIPAPLQRGCRVIGLDRRTLTLAADNGAIAAKLRQLGAEIAAKFQAKGYEVTVIQVQVQVNPPPYLPPATPRSLSRSGKDMIAGFAATLTDSPLKDALNRLSKKN